MIFMVLKREELRDMMAKESLENLKKVKKYLSRHPMASVMDVYANTGVSIPKILNFVRYGALSIKVRKAG